MAPRRVAPARARALTQQPARQVPPEMSEGDGDIEDGLQRQGEERDTRFDAGAEGGDAGDGQQQQARDADEDDFDEITGHPDIRVGEALPTLLDWLQERGISGEDQEHLRRGEASTFLPTTTWDKKDMVAFLPQGPDSKLEDEAGIEQRPKPDARLGNWERLQERLLRDHFWEMKHSKHATQWDREATFFDFLREARLNKLAAGGLPTPWLDADRRYLNVLPDQVRREGWLRNPPRRGATASEVDQWPGGLSRGRIQHTGPLMSTAVTSPGVSVPAWWKPIFCILPPLGGQQSIGEAVLRLDVEVLNLSFRDHSYYTEEDRVARLLSDLFKHHTAESTAGKIELLKAKVDAIKTALGGVPPDGEAAKSYRRELRESREKMDEEHRKNKDRERQLREEWNKLKYLRKQQNFNGAAIKMAWKNRKVDEAKEQEELEHEIDERLGELRDEYEAKLEGFTSRIEKLDALRTEKEEKRTLASSQSDSKSADRYALAIKKLDSRLKKLREAVKEIPGSSPGQEGFDDEGQRKALLDNYEAVHTRMPGEPLLVPVVLEDSIDDTDKCPAEEQSRRQRLKSTSFHVRLELNGEELKDRSDSLAMPSTAESSIEFAHRFPFAVAAPPETLFIHVYETSNGLTSQKKRLARVPVPIPGGGSLLPQKISQFFKVPFSGGEQFVTQVTRMKPDGTGKREEARHYVDGDLAVRVTWDTTAAASLVKASTGPGQSAVDSLMSRGDAPSSATSVGALPGIGGIQSDPNNPLDLPVIGGPSAVITEGGAPEDPTDRNTFFRLDKDDNDLNVLEGDSGEEKRNRLLLLRDTGKSDPALMDMPFKADDVFAEMLEGATDEDILDFKKGKKKKVLTPGEQKKQELKKRAGAALPSVRTREVATEEFVREEELPEFALSFDWLFNLLAPRNPLRPKMMDRKAQRGVTEATIVIQVVSASNLPVRFDPLADNHPDDEIGDDVFPYAEVRFGRHEKSTSAQQGTNVQWNDVLTLPFTSSSGNLNQEKGEVEFNIFDKVVVRDHGARGISERHEKRWLASFNLPFQTIFQNKQINGTVPVKLPLTNLGYRLPEPSSTVNLNFYATLDPCILPPEPDEDERGTQEGDELVPYAKKWMEEVEGNDMCKDRNIQVLVPGSKGETVFVTRYVWPQNPPPTCDSEETVARYVSLVPFALEDDEESGEQVDIWYTSHEFLQTQSGDWEEHAILLCNYFLKIKPDRPAFVALGTAMPDGDAAFVLTKDNVGGREQWAVWNPTTAQRFLQTDPDCPLRDIGMVFNHKNAWANIQQPSKNICFDSLNFEDKKCWKPFFEEVRQAFSTHILPQILTDVATGQVDAGSEHMPEG